MPQTGKNTRSVGLPVAERRHQRGFSLVELMIVLLIVAIMAFIAVPSFTRMIRSQKVVGASSALMSAFSIARTEAIKRGSSVAICIAVDPNDALNPTCAAGTDWAPGWFIFRGEAAADLGTATLLQVGLPTENVRMDAPAGLLFYDRRGLPPPGVNATVEVNAVPCTAGVDKQILITLNGAGHMHSEAQLPAAGDCP